MSQSLLLRRSGLLSVAAMGFVALTALAAEEEEAFVPPVLEYVKGKHTRVISWWSMLLFALLCIILLIALVLLIVYVCCTGRTREYHNEARCFAKTTGRVNYVNPLDDLHNNGNNTATPTTATNSAVKPAAAGGDSKTPVFSEPSKTATPDSGY